MKRKAMICTILAAAQLLALTACANGESSATRTASDASSRAARTHSEPDPAETAKHAASDVYNSASMVLYDMQKEQLDTNLLSGDYIFSGSDCEGKKFIIDASTEESALDGMQGGMQNYYDGLTELAKIAIRFENGVCIATAVQPDGSAAIYGCYPAGTDSSASFDSIETALAAAAENASTTAQ